MSAAGGMRGALIGVGSLVVVSTLWAQQPDNNDGSGGPGYGQGGAPGGPGYGQGGPPGGYGGYGGGGYRSREEREKAEFKLPDDARLVKLHEAFVRESEKLALEYEKKGEFDKARKCYEEILRLVPVYTKAQTALENVKSKQYSQEKKSVDILANKGWQDSGVIVQAGKPIIIRAEGTWTFRMTHDLTADGIEIPPELQAFRLGALVGMIDDGSGSGGTSQDANNSNQGGGQAQGGSPGGYSGRHHRSSRDKTSDTKSVFLIGANHEFTVEKTGKLMLRMYDA
ncbi:MAG TPA: tetratricopeptide repeat protein, partial [Pirellulales bacterium]|nr:tetratricopeptide repeat protein [Pirellulales bacterium]